MTRLPRRRRSVEIGYFPHEANSVNLIVNANFSGLLLDGNTDPLVARSWYASVPDYLDIVHTNHQLPPSQWTFKEPSEADLRQACAPYCLKACYNVNCYKGSAMAQQPYLKRSLVTLDNIQSLIDTAFAAQGAVVRGPRALDYFSIDIDGMDYFLLDSLLSNGYAPRVVATEYAAHMGQELALTRPYSPTFAAAATSFQYGASLMAFVKLLKRHDYRFIGTPPPPPPRPAYLPCFASLYLPGRGGRRHGMAWACPAAPRPAASRCCA
jgi:hypothetical protein